MHFAYRKTNRLKRRMFVDYSRFIGRAVDQFNLGGFAAPFQTM